MLFILRKENAGEHGKGNKQNKIEIYHCQLEIPPNICVGFFI